MEINPEEVEELENSPLIIYYQSFKSDVTKDDYTRKLKKVLCQFYAPILTGDPVLIREEEEKNIPVDNRVQSFPTADFEIRAEEFVRRSKEDTKWSEMLITTMIDKLIERSKLPKTDDNYIKSSSIKNYYWPQQKLLENNDVQLPWKRLRRKLPSQLNSDGVAYTRKQIQIMLSHADIEESLVILLAASSGIRAGAFELKWKHILPVYLFEEKYVWEVEELTDEIIKKGKLVCVLLKIYEGENEEYYALSTPEFYYTAQETRKKWTNEIGREPTGDDPVLKQKCPILKPLSPAGTRSRLQRLVDKCIRLEPLPPGEKRYETPIFNGFRYFFDKASKKAVSESSLLGQLILKEKMMGHGGLIPLNKNYFREIALDLIKEYIPAIPHLTISDDIRYKVELDKVTKENSELETVNMVLKQTVKEKDDLAKKYRDAVIQPISDDIINKKIEDFLKKHKEL